MSLPICLCSSSYWQLGYRQDIHPYDHLPVIIRHSSLNGTSSDLRGHSIGHGVGNEVSFRWFSLFHVKHVSSG